MKELNHLFSPKSIAIVGASNNEKSINSLPLQYLLDHHYNGEIYLVNPRHKAINGFRCYQEIGQINKQIDVALILLDSKKSVEAIEQCANANVRFAIILSSGFGEIGNEGKQIEDQIKSAIKDRELQLIGPNCIGLLNLEESIPLGFAYPFSMKEYLSGSVAICSQSGAYGLGLWTRLQEENIGVKYLGTTGNELNLGAADFLQYYANDPSIRVIGVYIEGFKDKSRADQFFLALQEAQKNGKQIVLLKAGVSEAGEMASKSHTSAITGSFEAFKVKCKQFGAYIVTDIVDQINLIKQLNTNKRVNGSRVAIVTTSGALGILLADHCKEFNLDVPNISPQLTNELKEFLPTYSSIRNPIDITAQVMNQPSLITKTLQAIAKSNEFDSIVLLSSTISGTVAESFAQSAIDVHLNEEIPIFVCLTGGEMMSKRVRHILEAKNVPYFRSSYQIAKLLKLTSLMQQEINLENQEINQHRNQIKVPSIKNWTEHSGKSWLCQNGFPIPDSTFITAEKGLESANCDQLTLSFPVVIKGQTAETYHKTEFGLVKTNIANQAELKEELINMSETLNSQFEQETIEGILIEEQIQSGVEMIVGAKWDPLYGPMLVFGSGGIFVEMVKDIQISKVPVSNKEAMDLIKNSKSYPILKGARRGIGYDINALAQFLVNFSEFIYCLDSGFEEIELNPVFVLPDDGGVKIVDALMITK